MAGADFRLEGGQQLQAIALRLKQVQDGQVIRKSLTKRLGAAVKPVVPEIRSAIKAIPSSGSSGSAHDARAAQTKRSSGSLRDAIARSVGQKTSLSGQQVGVRLRIDKTKMPDGQQALPALMNGSKPWRHPVYGHDVWVPQASHPYWLNTILPHLDAMRAEVSQVLNDITEAIKE